MIKLKMKNKKYCLTVDKKKEFFRSIEDLNIRLQFLLSKGAKQ